MPAKMTVCLYVPTLAPGGMERQAVVLAKALSRLGLNVHVVCINLEAKSGHYLKLLEGTNVTSHVIGIKDLAAAAVFAKNHPSQYPPISRHALPVDAGAEDALAATWQYPPMSRPSIPRLQFFGLLGRIAAIAPDILHCYHNYANCIGGYAGLRAGVSGILLSCRNLDPVSVGYANAELYMQRYKFLLAHTNVRLEANSHQGARAYANWLGIEASEIAINHNGIDPDIFTVSDPGRRGAVRRSLNIGDDAPVILYIARNSYDKSPTDMLDVAAQLRRRNSDVRFLAAGSMAEQTGLLEPAVRERGLSDTVRLLGIRSDIPDLLTAADVLLLTSRVEGFPNAIMEAMCAGLPVVATGVGGVPELVRHGEEGFLHPIGDIHGLADSLELLLGAPALRREMGEKARDRIVNNFTVDKLVERTISQYAALLNHVSVTPTLVRE